MLCPIMIKSKLCSNEFPNMNSITLVKNLLEQKNSAELDQYLSAVWNQIWSGSNQINYVKLRLFKTADKIKKISEMGLNFTNKRVLDIGCGNGTTLLYLQKYFGIEGLGIDISNEAIKELRSSVKEGHLSFCVGDHRDLRKVDSDQFDIVLSFGVMEHFDEYGLALAEARRVLKKDGKLVLIQPHLLSFGIIQEYCLRLRGRWKFGKQKDFSCFRYQSLLQQMGFKNIKFMTTPPYPDMKITRILDSIVKKIIPFWGHYVYLIAEK